MRLDKCIFCNELLNYTSYENNLHSWARCFKCEELEDSIRITYINNNYDDNNSISFYYREIYILINLSEKLTKIHFNNNDDYNEDILYIKEILSLSKIKEKINKYFILE